MKTLLQPDGWPRPKGYANGIAATGQFIFTAGVIGWNEDEIFKTTDLVGQARQVFLNTKTILAEAGAGPQDIVRMTWYVTDMQAYRDNLKPIGAAWQEIFGKVFPCMACIEVSALVEEQAKIEIETTAVMPIKREI